MSLRSGIVVLSLAVTVTGGSPQAFAQGPEGGAKLTHAHISYTGDLFGYTRLPDKQLLTDTHCLSNDATADELGGEMLQVVESAPSKGVLVGVGDNFAPELFSRLLFDAQNPVDSKDAYVWDYVSSPPHWLPYEKLKTYKPLSDDLDAGNGRIPVDNVGCFLARAGYAAIVPGKQDFHYGPEYLRELARFLASIKPNGTLTPVQVLY